jgi:hypothetical protein
MSFARAYYTVPKFLHLALIYVYQFGKRMNYGVIRIIKRLSVASVVLSPQHNQNCSSSSISFFLLQNSSIQIHSKVGSPTQSTRRNYRDVS